MPEENRRETHLRLIRAGRRTVKTVTERRRRDVHAVIERVPRNLQGDLARAMAAFAAAAEETWPSSGAQS